MAIIVEDGTIVINANSFVSLQDYIDYATTLGLDVNVSGKAEEQLISAGQFINIQNNLKGNLVSRDQPMAYPRSGLVLENWSWLHTEIPRQVIQLQMTKAIEVFNGFDVITGINTTSSSGQVVKKERIEGAITVEYETSGDNGTKVSSVSSSQALLSVLTNNNGLTLVRS